jgi:GNAT superfamily N-acetyltransferase
VWKFNSEYLYIKETMKDIKQFVKTTIREFLNENINNISYSIDHAYNENILVNAKIDGVTIGTLSIIDETNYLSPEDEPTFTILNVFVDKQYRKMGIYINLIKYFLSKNKYGVKSLSSEKNPEFDTEPRSVYADNFWKHIYINQKKYGVYVEKYDDNYEISLK